MRDPAAPLDNEYLTVGEVATRLRLSKMTVYRFVHAGTFPGTLRVGRGFRIPATAVRAWLDESVIT